MRWRKNPQCQHNAGKHNREQRTGSFIPNKEQPIKLQLSTCYCSRQSYFQFLPHHLCNREIFLLSTIWRAFITKLSSPWRNHLRVRVQYMSLGHLHRHRHSYQAPLISCHLFLVVIRLQAHKLPLASMWAFVASLSTNLLLSYRPELVILETLPRLPLWR